MLLYIWLAALQNVTLFFVSSYMKCFSIVLHIKIPGCKHRPWIKRCELGKCAVLLVVVILLVFFFFFFGGGGGGESHCQTIHKSPKLISLILSLFSLCLSCLCVYLRDLSTWCCDRGPLIVNMVSFRHRRHTKGTADSVSDGWLLWRLAVTVSNCPTILGKFSVLGNTLATLQVKADCR